MANYQILNHIGEELISSVTEEQLEEMRASELNVFGFDDSAETNIFEEIKKQKINNPEFSLESIRIHKEIL